MNIAILTVALFAVILYFVIELCKASVGKPLKDDKDNVLNEYETFWTKEKNA